MAKLLPFVPRERSVRRLFGPLRLAPCEQFRDALLMRWANAYYMPLSDDELLDEMPASEPATIDETR